MSGDEGSDGYISQEDMSVGNLSCEESFNESFDGSISEISESNAPSLGDYVEEAEPPNTRNPPNTPITSNPTYGPNSDTPGGMLGPQRRAPQGRRGTEAYSSSATSYDTPAIIS